jgi:hypothetical protein
MRIRDGAMEKKPVIPKLEEFCRLRTTIGDWRPGSVLS